MTMERVNAIARAMESAALMDGAEPKEIVAACAALSLKYQVAAGLVPQGVVIPFERDRRAHRHLRSVANRTPLDCA
jgi:hypothetical protein